MDLVPGAVLLLNRKGIVVFANEAASALLSMADEPMAEGAAFWKFLIDDQPIIAGELDGFLSTPGASWSQERSLRVSDEGSTWVSIEVTNLLEEPSVGALVATVGSATTRRHVANQRQAIADFGLMALRGATISHLCNRAVELAVEFIGADVAAVLERTAETSDEVVVRSIIGWPRQVAGQRISANRSSATGQSLLNEVPVIIDDLTEPGFPGDLLLIEAGIRSLVSVTILGPEGPWGSLTAMSKDAASFNLSDANAIQALANIIAAAADRDRGEAERRHQKLYDPVTDLPGRALLTDRIELALSSSTRLDGAILAAHLIDLDAFRRINDSLGYDAGDTLLAQVGERLSGIMSNDETVASLGGDVFVVVSRHPDEQSPHLLSERILDAVRNPFSVRDQVVGLTASIGVVVAHDEDRDANALLRDAESAMYEAKRLGRDRSWVFNHDHRRRLMDRLGIEADLRAALASDQLDVYYQPIVDCRSGHVVSVEALVRWHHPINGLVPPDQFIEIAEESGLILPLGQWVLETACAQLAAWRAQPDLAYLGMSVNLSARQLGDPGLLDKTLAALDAADLDPTGLSFEITETMVVADLPGATKALEDLNALGIRIVIDDFGTGYSSLSYVKNLPITCIKIDRSFISGIERDSADRSIVAALATLARELDILVVAEGVDSRAQLVIVQKLGCTLIQGYLYAPALPAGAFDVWARAHEDAI